MNLKLNYFLLLLPYLTYGQIECNFSVEAIQKVFDSYEEFRTLHAFDPTDSGVPITKYSTYTTLEGFNNANMKIPTFFISDNTKIGGKKFQSAVNGFSFKLEENNFDDNFSYNDTIHYERRSNGYAFYKPGPVDLFVVPIQDLNIELSSSVRSQLSHEHLQIFDQIIRLRKKLYAFKEKLNQSNIQILFYEVTPLKNGYIAQYQTTISSIIAHTSYNDGENVGRFSCGETDQDYVIVNEKVELKPVPFNPIYV